MRAVLIYGHLKKNGRSQTMNEVIAIMFQLVGILFLSFLIIILVALIVTSIIVLVNDAKERWKDDK